MAQPCFTTSSVSIQAGTAKLFIRTYQSSLNNPPEKLEDLGFDVNKFCDYASKMLKTLHDAGGNDNQVSLKLYRALVWTKLTTIACTKYTSLVIHGQWLFSPSKSSTSKKRAINDIVALKAEFKQKEKIIRYFKSTISSSSKQPHCHTLKELMPVLKGSSKYNIDAQIGNGKDF
eukprot:4728376-Ditylum_brightwellii.AAC.1